MKKIWQYEKSPIEIPNTSRIGEAYPYPCRKDILCRIIIDRIRSGVDDRLRKDTLERTGRI